MSPLLASDKTAEQQLFFAPVTVNGIEIPHAHIYAEMQYYPAPTLQEAAYRAARALVLGHLLRAEAAAQGLCAENEDINGEAFESVVEQLLAQSLDIAESSRAEREDFYTNNRHHFLSSPLAEVRHILLPVTPGDDAAVDAQETLAQKLLQEITLADDPLVTFCNRARADSACESAKTGGSLGQVSGGQMVRAFDQAVFTGNTGLVPHPVRTEYGWHLIYVEQVQLGRQLEFDYVEEKIREYLAERRRRAALDAYMHGLVAAAEIGGIDMLAEAGIPN
ncbi:peptidylprolyl isomerase [Microbulbifer harenosus]|uniref:peptidylprolyl isomerase n=1 Tax=Microbulbifer harenosus TaxID=2576840 RepID=A0ABY2UDB5_9GAMM|nr:MULTISPECIES: peptidylprolyl isomerase [Microbulbifer]QIL90581.1 peptidylprolyl isomerase [Microbulbifer sp. SH-1]TLM74352.1 peptidylprolyl isomerase [Microbulbifer harenosus]